MWWGQIINFQHNQRKITFFLKSVGPCKNLIVVPWCTGHIADKNKPTFPLMENFKGEIILSNEYTGRNLPKLNYLPFHWDFRPLLVLIRKTIECERHSRIDNIWLVNIAFYIYGETYNFTWRHSTCTLLSIHVNVIKKGQWW